MSQPRRYHGARHPPRLASRRPARGHRSVLTRMRRVRTPGRADTLETHPGGGGGSRRPPHIFRRHPATLPTPCTHTAVPRRPRRRPRSVHDSPRRTPVPQASHTAPAPEPSQRETPVRRNDARLVAAPRCSDLPAPPAAPLHASMQVYQYARACVCTSVATSVARGACAEFSRRCTVLALSLRRRALYQGLTACCAATLNLGSKEILHGTATLQYGPGAQHWRDDSLQPRSVPTDAGYRNRRSKTTANPPGGVAQTRCRVAKHLIGHTSAVTLANAQRGPVKYSTLLEHSARSVFASGAGPSCVHVGGADSESRDHRSYLRHAHPACLRYHESVGTSCCVSDHARTELA